MNKTNIAWTNYTWNPITGCTAVSDGCKNCYAKIVHERFYNTSFSEIVFHEDRLAEPKKKKKGKMIFVGSMTDLFQDGIDFDFIFKIWVVMVDNSQHTFQILTKRPDRMREFLLNHAPVPAMTGYTYGKDYLPRNIWLGVTAENQKEADARIPILLDIPAAKRFVSIEPMIGEVDLTMVYPDEEDSLHYIDAYIGREYQSGEKKDTNKLDQIIVGGESGAKSKVREMKPKWVQKIYDDCKANDVPFFFKQWGAAHKPTCNYEFEKVQQFPVLNVEKIKSSGVEK
jgi:protein gp37